ncbi:MAG: exosortase A [Proteobacteria bacterium]|nr:exosortase A [Pseudomonadota bacterium]
MLPDLAPANPGLPDSAGHPAAPALTLAWRDGLVRLVLGWLVLGLLAARQWAAMADQWWNSSTYTHVLVVPAILAWLVSQRLPELARLAPRAWPAGLVLVAMAATVWLAGSLAGVALVEQLGAVLLLIAAVPALLGPRVAMALLFPLAYALFLVPAGDELVPLLQTITAKITVWLVHLSGVSARIDGVFIDTPAGLFRVAEACSGVKFLIAMVALAVLAAHVCFVSARRRLGFLAFAIAMPVLANGVRAWGTVYLAQRWGAEWAGGFDHIVYGWFFFAAVLAGTLALWWRWFDRPADAPLVDVEALLSAPWLARLEQAAPHPRATLLALAGIALAVAGWAHSAAALEAPLPERLAVPAVRGWRVLPDAPTEWWEPRAAGAGRRLLVRYGDSAGHRVDVFYAIYAAQGPGRKASGQGEGAVRIEQGWNWFGPAPGGAGFAADRLHSDHGLLRLAETSYRSGELVTGSAARLRLANFADRLLLRPRPTALLILSAEAVPGAPEPAASLAAFRQAMGPATGWMDATAKGG